MGWPLGLLVLMEHGIDLVYHDIQGHTILEWAILLGDIEAVAISCQRLSTLSNKTWAGALRTGTEQIISTVASAINQKVTQHSQSLHDGYNCLSYNTNYEELYSVGIQNFDSVQPLFDAGFLHLDVDLAMCGIPSAGISGSGTPLWKEASGLGSGLGDFRMDILIWFIENGAKLNSVHPEWRTMPLHLIAEKMILRPIWNPRDQPGIHRRMLQERSPDLYGLPDRYPKSVIAPEIKPSKSYKSGLDFLHTIFSSEQRDHCTCRCSIAGCNVISSALKVVRLSEFYGSCSEIKDIMQIALWIILQYLPGPISRQVGHFALRTLTFDALNLTHTCHDHRHSLEEFWMFINPMTPLSKIDIDDIQYTEQRDIDCLEELLQYFEDIWDQSDCTFLVFLDIHWKPKMEKISAEKDAPRENEIQKIEEAGVEVKAFGPEPPPPTTGMELLPEYGSVEWFDWRVETVLDGTYRQYPGWY